MTKLEEIRLFLENSNFKFIDEAMIQVQETQEKVIMDEMCKACVKLQMGVFIDEAKLKHWIQMCIDLDTIPNEMAKDIAIINKLNRLEKTIRERNETISQLSERIRTLEEGYYND